MCVNSFPLTSKLPLMRKELVVPIFQEFPEIGYYGEENKEMLNGKGIRQILWRPHLTGRCEITIGVN